MRPLAALERFLERMFERPTARLLHARLEPVTLVHRLERAIDEERQASPDGMIAPTRFRIEVSTADAASLGRLSTLEDDLGTAALEHSRRRGYRIREQPTAVLLGAADLRPGDVRIAVGFAEGPGSVGPHGVQPERTLVHPLPPVIPAGAVLRVIGPGHPPRDIALDGHPLTIGRATDVEVVVVDPLVSRRHARLAPRGGRLVLADLGSTNGTRVNGQVISEVVIGPGDRIELGATRLEILLVGASPVA